MGCQWTTVKGKRVRFQPVAAPAQAQMLTEINISMRMAALGLEIAKASPAFTREELRNAVMRLWHDSERGYIVETRLNPRSRPVYHVVPQAEATALASGNITGNFIARMLHTSEPVDN